MAKRSEGSSEASQRALNDDDEAVAPEPSIETIIKRIRARSEGSSADAQKAEGSPPFARSRFLQVK